MRAATTIAALPSKIIDTPVPSATRPRAVTSTLARASALPILIVTVARCRSTTV